MEWGSQVTYLGATTLRGSRVRFGIKDSDRMRHLCVLGKAPREREAFLASVALQDINRSIPTIVIDTSGEVGKLVIERLQENDLPRLIFLDPAEAEYPYSHNPLEEYRFFSDKDAALHRLETLIESLYHIQPSPLSAYAASLLLKRDDATLVTLFHLATNELFRAEFLNDDERAEFESLLEEHADSVQRIEEHGKYLAKDTLMRNLFAQRTSKFLFTHDAEKGAPIVIIDLSRVRMYPTRITPLARLWVEVARLAGAKRTTPVSVVMHDILRYFTESDIDRLFQDQHTTITVADASFGEGDKERREKALAQCGSVASFASHATDRPLIERAFYPYVEPEELQEASEGELLVALTIDAVRSKPFFGAALPLPQRHNISYQDTVLRSRDAYTTPRLTVDGEVRSLFAVSQPQEQDDIDDDEEGGSFSDAFRSIFNPSQDVPPPQKIEEKEEASTKETPEIPEDKLKEMLYVHPRFI